MEFEESPDHNRLIELESRVNEQLEKIILVENSFNLLTGGSYNKEIIKEKVNIVDKIDNEMK